MIRLRIVQIENFYGGYLRSLGGPEAPFSRLGFDAQVRYLLASGFSGGHNTSPHLDPSRWRATYLVPNCEQAQRRWAAEHGIADGAEPVEILLAQLRHYAPDVLYLSDIPGFDFRLLDLLPKRPLLVGWHATRVDERLPWSRFDLVLSGIEAIRRRVCELGAAAAEDFMPAAPPFIALDDGNDQSHALVFSGSFCGGIHNARARQLTALSQRLRHAPLDLFTGTPFAAATDTLRFFPAVYGNAVMALYARAGIVLDSRGDFDLGEAEFARDTSNMRVFEATRAGAMLLTESSPNLDRYFRVGEEIETFSSFDELADKANFYSAPENAARREQIASAGAARVRREHLVEHRAAWLDAILSRHLDRMHGRGASVPVEATITTSVPDSRARGGELFLLLGEWSSLLFSITQAAWLHDLKPDAPIALACLDAPSAELADALGVGLQVIDVSADPQFVRERSELRLLVRILDRLLQQAPDIARITVVGRHLLLSSLTDFVVDGDAVYVGQAVNVDDPAAIALHEGAGAVALLSVPVSEAGRQWLARMLAGPADVEGWAAACAGAHIVPVRTPDGPAPPAANELAALGPLSLREETWYFEEPEGAAHWAEYFRACYLPYLRAAQGLRNNTPKLAELGSQYLPARGVLPARRRVDAAALAQSGYRLLDADAYRHYQGEAMGWDTPEVARIQHTAFQRLLGELRDGHPRADLLALSRIFHRLLEPGMAVLEQGSGSGYNREVIAALGRPFEYAGVDIAGAMVALGRQCYPDSRFEQRPANAMGFADGEFDIVFNGASLMHTLDVAGALREAARVARRYVVLHTVTVGETAGNVYFEKNAYGGSRVAEVCFASAALDDMLARERLMPCLLEPSIPYDLEPLVGAPTRSVSLACAKLPEVDAQTPRSHAYCTYFDVNYLPRAVLMIRSLLRFEPGAQVYALCMDDIAAEALPKVLPEVHVVRLSELTAADPEFAAARDNRSQIEWYFTATSCYVNHLMGTRPQVKRWIYLDADLYFFASPAPLLQESELASVHIVEHRFSERWAGHIKYGRFNVGWIAFNTTKEGRQVVADYRADCLEWCYDRLEGDRFGDQKYLDRWPQRYPGCRVCEFRGANVAVWNIEQWPLTRFGRHLFAGNDVLVFYHFQQIRRLPSGVYETKNAPDQYGEYYDAVYRPYLRELSAADRELQAHAGTLPIRDLRYQQW